MFGIVQHREVELRDAAVAHQAAQQHLVDAALFGVEQVAQQVGGAMRVVLADAHVVGRVDKQLRLAMTINFDFVAGQADGDGAGRAAVHEGADHDGLVGDDGLIEVKCRRGKAQVETILAGEVPAENMAQLQAGLFVSGRAWLDYVSYAGGMHLWTTRVTPDPAWFDAIRAAVEAFEAAVFATVDAYLTAVEGLPLTERPLTDMVI